MELSNALEKPCCSLVCCNNAINKMCCTLYKDRVEFETMLSGIELHDMQKQHIQSRYINILENLKKRARKYSIVFFTGHFIITVGSLFVPALLSIQNSSTTVSLGSGYSVPVYTITFIVSLLVTIFNGILTLFKVDKKFYFLTTTVEKLRSEGWQYMGLTGRYSGALNNTTPSHANQFLYFAHQIEKIKMKQVEEEFYKADDSGTKNDPRSNGKPGDLYPPSLDKPIATMSSIISPQEVKDAMSSIVKAQNIPILEPIPLMMRKGPEPATKPATKPVTASAIEPAIELTTAYAIASETEPVANYVINPVTDHDTENVAINNLNV